MQTVVRLIFERSIAMEQILALVQQILDYFKEVDSAAVIEMIKNFVTSISGLLG